MVGESAFAERKKPAEEERKAEVSLPKVISRIAEELHPYSIVFVNLGAALAMPLGSAYPTAIAASKAVELAHNSDNLKQLSESNPSPAPLLYALEFLGINKTVAESNPSPAPKLTKFMKA